MGVIEDFKRAVNDAARKNLPITTVWADAAEIDLLSQTMTARGALDGLAYYGVSLGYGTVLQVPMPGSRCLLGMVGQNAANMYLIHCTDVQQVVVTAGDSQVEINRDGIRIERGGDNLRDVHAEVMDKLAALCDAVNAIVVTNGVGPNIPLINAIKTDIEGPIKERLNGILK